MPGERPRAPHRRPSWPHAMTGSDPEGHDLLNVIL